MIRREYITRLLYTIAISALICVGASIWFSFGEITLDMMMKSVGLGTLIWLVSEWVTESFSRKWPYHIFPSYVALFIIIAFGTSVGTWLMGIMPASTILIICACAELFGFIIAIIYRYSYQKKLNDQLKKYKSNI